MPVDYGRSLDIMEPDYSPETMTPESLLWTNVIIKYLDDLDKSVRILRENIIPRQRDLILKGFLYKSEGPDYWIDRMQRKNLIQEKVRVKREILQHKYELEHDWMRDICSFAGIKYEFLLDVSHRIIRGELKVKYNNHFKARLTEFRLD